jgi:diguanylate cyclase (GGDEF)-like protein
MPGARPGVEHSRRPAFPMSANDSLFIVIGILMLLFGLGWGMAGGPLGLSRSASLRWMGFCLGCAGAGGVGLLVPWLPPIVESGLRNLFIVAAFMLMRRGALSFLGLPLRGAEHAFLLAAVALAPVAEAAGLLPAALRSAAMAAVLSWLALASAAACARRMHREFGWIASGFVAGPMFGAAALFAWRTRWALDIGSHPLIHASTDSIQPALLVALFTLAVVFNLALCYLVVTRLVRRLRDLASRDPLTDLLNRRTTMEALHAEHLRLRRGGEGCVVLAIDVDHFKRINDIHGHAAGDEALRRLASVLADSLRETDVLGRTGGEEFLLLLRMSDQAGGMFAAQRIQRALAAQPVIGANPPLHLTVSIGMVVLPPGTAQPVDDWLLRADAALYQAKAQGRDRVEVAAPIEATGAGRIPSSTGQSPVHT